MNTIVHSNPWLCPKWLSHYHEDCTCRTIRTAALAMPNLGMADENVAKLVMSSAINQLVKHKTFGYNGNFIDFAREFNAGADANPWLPKCMFNAIMEFADELNEKCLSPSRLSLQPEGFNMAPEYFFPKMSSAICLSKSPERFLLYHVDNDATLAARLTAAGAVS